MARDFAELPTIGEHRKPTQAQLAEAERYDGKAGERREHSRESFDRCDTDGCVTQWCLDHGANVDQARARILRHGGQARFKALFHSCDECDGTGKAEVQLAPGDLVELQDRGVTHVEDTCPECGGTGCGARAPFKLIDTRYGSCFAEFHEGTGEFTGTFIGASLKDATVRRKGYAYGIEWADAWATFGGSGTGLSGLATLHTKVYRKDYGHPDLPDICRRAKGATR